MDRVKKILGRLFIVLFASMSVANVAKAAGTVSTDVQITIEAPQIVSGTNDENNIENNMESDIESVQTGDKASTGVYVTVAVAALAVVAAFLVKKKKKKAFMAVAAVLLSVTCLGHTSQAADATENVNVTIPTSISVVFDETGTTSVSEFEISNRSLVPITFEKINVTECNDWKLASNSENIPVNTKQLAFVLEEGCLQPGENIVEISIPEGTSKNLDIQVKRGAWTDTDISETALNLEFEYTLGVKAFQLSFDANGGGTDVTSMEANNGDVVTLPEAERDGYVFKGWQDEKGNLYTSEYVMPIGNVKLTAKWQETDAYAVYSEDDYSLTFYRSETPIQAGTTYNGKKVTAVYTGFENASYEYATIPWRSYDTAIKRIEFHDKISPINTNHWFRALNNVQYLDVTKLDTSQVTSMSYMFSNVGYSASELYCVGIEDLDVSNVTDMFFMFYNCGVKAKTVHIGDLSKWDVSNVNNMCRTFGNVASTSESFYFTGLENWDVSKVTNMSMMFYRTGINDPTWSLNLSRWNVSKVEYHVDFDTSVESKVIEPKWVK